MARASKLKVYRTPIGFHDAYVAAASQKAALAAWGSERDLFARGIAEVVTDPALMDEPLAAPGKVIRRSRGTAAEQIAALPKAKSKKRTVEPAPDAPPHRPPEPDRDELDGANAAVEAAERRFAEELRALDEEQARIARKQREVERTRVREMTRLEEKRDRADAAYRAAMEAWRSAEG